jgi:hypothetical protein
MVVSYGSDDTGAVGADKTGLVLGLENVGDADHVYIKTISLYNSDAVRMIRTMLRDTLSDAIEEQHVSLKLLIGRKKSSEGLTRTKQRGPSQQRWPPRYQRQREEDWIQLAQ